MLTNVSNSVADFCEGYPKVRVGGIFDIHACILYTNMGTRQQKLKKKMLRRNQDQLTFI